MFRKTYSQNLKSKNLKIHFDVIAYVQNVIAFVKHWRMYIQPFASSDLTTGSRNYASLNKKGLFLHYYMVALKRKLRLFPKETYKKVNT